MDAAHSDAELLVSQGLKKKAEYIRKLESNFQAIDMEGFQTVLSVQLFNTC